MSDETPADGRHHHSVRERLDAARAAADEMVAEESGQLGGEVSALAVPFEEAIAAIGAAIHPDRLAEHEVVGADGEDPGASPGAPADSPGAAEPS